MIYDEGQVNYYTHCDALATYFQFSMTVQPAVLVNVVDVRFAGLFAVWVHSAKRMVAARWATRGPAKAKESALNRGKCDLIIYRPCILPRV